MHSTYYDSLILRLCKQPRTFEFISLQMNGFDPVELLDALKVLESQRKLSNISGLWCNINKEPKKLTSDAVSAKTDFFNEHIGFFGLFDKPHPLDFEWRNTTGSLTYLIAMVQKMNDVS
ncbi:MAG: class SAM-dependent methyltransferase, partial [Segetibacter sp.]|nr:class SAM-dependent methyltransferase [Segetibacter sp.]